MQKKPNRAQWLLIIMGGTAQLVGGWMGHFWADNQTQKRIRTKPRGNYGAALKRHFDTKRMLSKPLRWD